MSISKCGALGPPTRRQQEAWVETAGWARATAPQRDKVAAESQEVRTQDQAVAAGMEQPGAWQGTTVHRALLETLDLDKQGNRVEHRDGRYACCRAP